MLKHATVPVCHTLNHPLLLAGDVHGQYTALNTFLTQHWGKMWNLEADWALIGQARESVDSGELLLPTLAFLGDIIDRGMESEKMLQWAVDHLSAEDVFFIWGNHEEMMYRALGGELEYEQAWLGNGGAWFSVLGAKQKRIAERNIERLYAGSYDALTFVLNDDPTLHIGAVHGECPSDDWEAFVASRRLRNQALWGRDNIMGRSGIEVIKNIHTVYAGHTPKAEHHTIGNQRWINRRKGIGFTELRVDKKDNLLVSDLFQPRMSKLKE